MLKHKVSNYRTVERLKRNKKCKFSVGGALNKVYVKKESVLSDKFCVNYSLIYFFLPPDISSVFCSS